MSSTDAPSEQARTARTRATAVLDRARAALLDEPSGARDLRPLADACLDVTLAHPSGQAHLLASGRQHLSGLVRDPEARAVALLRLRRFREVVGALDDRGLTAGHLVAGVVVLPGGSELPVLLRSCRVAGAGDGDASVVVEGPVALNPALTRELARRSSGAVDLPAVLGERLRTAGSGFDPYPLLDLVQAALPAVPGAVLRRRLLLAPVSLDGDRVVQDLDRLREHVPAHSPLAWVGEDWDGDAAQVLGTVGQDLPDVSAPEAAVTELLDRFVPARLDPDQRRVLAAVLTGHSIGVDAPPGTGATTCAVAVAAVAAATGRRCLVVVPTRAEGDVLVDRLVALGLGDLVSDGSGGGSVTSREAAESVLAASTPVGGAGQDNARRHQEAGERYRDAVAELHRVRRPWQVTRADVLEVLATAAVEGPRVTDVVLEQDPGTALSREQLEGLADDLAEAVRLGALDDVTTAWTGARITDRQGAQEALGLARRLRDELVREARSAVGDLAHGTGTVRAVTVDDVADRHRLFVGLQTTLDRLVPEVFDVPILDLVAATADHEFRRTTDYAMGGPTRWRLQRRARRLVRPGVEVDDRQLHRLLSSAAAQRLDWQRISEGSGWAHLPSATGAMVDRLGDLVRACERLDLLHPGLRLGRATLDQVLETAVRLLDDEAALDDLPRRTLLEQRVGERGGGVLLQRLRALPVGHVSPDMAARELRLSWWLGVAEATAPATGERGATVEAVDVYAASQQDWVAAAAGRVRAARDGLDPQSRLSDPVRVLVPSDVADLPLDEHVDVVVLDDAGRSGFVEVCGALARTAQVVALGDVGPARPGSAATVLGGCLPVDRLRTAHRTHDATLAALAGATGSSRVATAGSPERSTTVTRTFLDEAVGLPSAETEQLDSTEVEVEHVVQETLRLVVELAAQDPPRSVAVVGLTRAHAAAVAAGVRRAVRAYPALADAFSSARPEPVVVASVDQARGVERDEVLLSTGFARTPHGRVIHRFGALDAPGGAGLLTTAVSRARHRLHVVTALRSRDLDASRLRTPGAQALARVLAAVEAAADGPGRGGGRSAGRVSADADPVPGDRSAVLSVLARDLLALGAEVAPGPGGGLAVRRGHRALVVDVDVAQPDPAVVAGRRWALVEAGWQHRLVAAELVAADVAGVAARLLGLPDAGPAAPAAQPAPVEPVGTEAVGASPTSAEPVTVETFTVEPAGPTPVAEPTVTAPVVAEPVTPDPAAEPAEPAAEPAEPEPEPERESEPQPQPEPESEPEPEPEPQPASTPPPAAPSRPPSADPVVPQVSPDDTDRGWGESTAEDEDDRILRERPPHW